MPESYPSDILAPDDPALQGIAELFKVFGRSDKSPDLICTISAGDLCTGDC